MADIKVVAMLALARALFRSCSALVLDEPSSNLVSGE